MSEKALNITLFSKLSHYISLFHLFQMLNTDRIVIILFANIDRASYQQANSLDYHSIPSLNRNLVILPYLQNFRKYLIFVKNSKI